MTVGVGRRVEWIGMKIRWHLDILAGNTDRQRQRHQAINFSGLFPGPNWARSAAGFSRIIPTAMNDPHAKSSPKQRRSRVKSAIRDSLAAIGPIVIAFGMVILRW